MKNNPETYEKQHQEWIQIYLDCPVEQRPQLLEKIKAAAANLHKKDPPA